MVFTASQITESVRVTLLILLRDLNLLSLSIIIVINTSCAAFGLTKTVFSFLNLTFKKTNLPC